MLQGWDLQKIADKPAVWVVMGVFVVGLCFWTRSRVFRKLNRQLNPQYQKTTMYLEEQLAILEGHEPTGAE